MHLEFVVLGPVVLCGADVCLIVSLTACLRSCFPLVCLVLSPVVCMWLHDTGCVSGCLWLCVLLCVLCLKVLTLTTNHPVDVETVQRAFMQTHAGETVVV